MRDPNQEENSDAEEQTSPMEDLALDSHLVLCSSKHSIEPRTFVGQKDRWGVKLHYLQRRRHVRGTVGWSHGLGGSTVEQRWQTSKPWDRTEDN